MSNVAHLPNVLQDLPDQCVTGPDFAQRAGITYRMLDHWTRVGYLVPAEAHPGSGYPRAYPLEQLPMARLMRRLIDSGLMPATARSVAEQLLEHGHTTIAGIRIDLPQDL